MSESIQKMNRVLLKSVLTFFIINSVLQSTAFSLKLSNDIIIIIVFAISCLQIFFVLQKKKIKIFTKNKEIGFIQYIKPIDIVVFVFLAINTIWIIVVPPANGFSISEAIREAGMLVLFILYFPLAVLIRIKEIDITWYRRVFYFSVLVLAIWHIIMWVLEKENPGFFRNYLDFMQSIPIFRTGEIIVGWGIVRISVSNSILLGIGLIMTFSSVKKLKVYHIFYVIIFLTAILCTFLRSIWLGLILGCFLLFLNGVWDYITKKQNYIKGILILFSVMLITVVALDSTLFENSIMGRTLNTFSRTVETQSEASSEMPQSEVSSNMSQLDKSEKKENKNESAVFDEKKNEQGARISNDIKIEQIKKLLAAWKESPLVGRGYGSYIPNYLRSNTDPYAYEMTAFSLLLKVGIVGVLVWGLLLSFSVLMALKKIKSSITRITWIASIVCFLVAIQTNPLLFSANALSFIIYAILFVVADEEDIMEKENDISSNSDL